MHPELNQLIARHRVLDAKRTRRLTVFMWILALLTVALLVAPAFGRRHGPSWGDAGVGLGGAAVFGGLALLASAASRKNTDRLQRAFEQPRTALWIYLQDRQMYGQTLYRFVILRLADGSLASLATPSNGAERAFATLRAHMPHAIAGFGSERQARYEAARRAA